MGASAGSTQVDVILGVLEPLHLESGIGGGRERWMKTFSGGMASRYPPSRSLRERRFSMGLAGRSWGSTSGAAIAGISVAVVEGFAAKETEVAQGLDAGGAEAFGEDGVGGRNGPGTPHFSPKGLHQLAIRKRMGPERKPRSSRKVRVMDSSRRQS